ncbi:hypothetical protein [Kitasatospora griseola]|uniref:hypothetical protein n=1 Tax=Kitasatospora griseola TaxID=2064 RepID=UPI0036612575
MDKIVTAAAALKRARWIYEAYDVQPFAGEAVCGWTFAVQHLSAKAIEDVFRPPYTGYGWVLPDGRVNPTIHDSREAAEHEAHAV